MHAHSLASNQLLSLYNDIPCMDLLVTIKCELEDSDNLITNILLQYKTYNTPCCHLKCQFAQNRDVEV